MTLDAGWCGSTTDDGITPNGEGIIADAGHPTAYRHLFQFHAAVKRPFANRGHRIGDDHTRQFFAPRESVILDCGHRARYSNTFHMITAIETAVGDGGHTVRNHHTMQVFAVAKSSRSNGRDRTGDGHAPQFGAFVECSIADTRHVVSHASVCHR